MRVVKRAAVLPLSIISKVGCTGMITTKAGPGGTGPDGSAFPYNNGRPGRGGGTAVAFATDAGRPGALLTGVVAGLGANGGQGGLAA